VQAAAGNSESKKRQEETPNSIKQTAPGVVRAGAVMFEDRAAIEAQLDLSGSV
jgi:hypothetical protein